MEQNFRQPFRMQSHENYGNSQAPKPFIPPKTEFPELEKRFPNVPAVYIFKILAEIKGKDNVITSLTSESQRIKQVGSPNWVKDYFKAFPCENSELCQNFHCLHYHSLSEKRRIYRYKEYSPTMCPQLLQCIKQDECPCAHTLNEVLYHPYNYRANFCPYFQLQNDCIYREICPFSHEKGDTDLIFQEFLGVHDELSRLDSEMQHIESQIMQKLKEEEDLSKKLRCICGHRKEYIRSPCGHAACQACFTVPNCKICLGASQVIKIRFE